jgi:hypothetical protein
MLPFKKTQLLGLLVAEPTCWTKHIKRFLKGDDHSPTGRKAYALHTRLSDNTFRVKLSKYKASPAYKNSIQQQTPEREAKKRTTRKSNQDVPKAGKARLTRVANYAPSSTKDNFIFRDDTRTFKRGHTASMVTGAYAKKAFLSPEYAEKSQLSFDDVVALLTAQYLLINDNGVSIQKSIKKTYSSGEPLIKKSMNAQGEVVEVELSEDDALFDTAIKISGPMSRLAKVIIASKIKMEEMELKQRDEPTFSKREISDTIIEIMARKEKNKLSAVEICYAFYALGQTPPPGLEREKEIEMRNAEPAIPQGDGVTPDEAAEMQEYLKGRRKEQPKLLEAMKLRNAKIYAGNDGVGDKNFIEKEKRRAGIKVARG